MPKKVFVFLTALIFVCTANCQADKGLRIGKGDAISIESVEDSSLNETARVDDLGCVPLRIGGEVEVIGLTPGEAARKIEGVFRDGGYLLDPHILVTIQDYVTESASVLGEVAKPGAFALSTSRPVSAVIALAGGITQLADRNILVQRRNSNAVLSYFLPNNEAELRNPTVMVEPGDTVVVPKAKLVYILGDVKLPGGYTMTTNDSRLSVLQLLARAAGLNPTAVPAHARLIRKTVSGYEELPLQIGSMQKGKIADIQLMPDDIVYVPFSFLRSIVISGTSGIPSSLASAAVYRF